MIQVGDHVRITMYDDLNDGPPVGTVGTVGAVFPRFHDDAPLFCAAIFDWDGRLASHLPRGTWLVGEDEVEVIQHCQRPGPCICTPRERPMIEP